MARKSTSDLNLADSGLGFSLVKSQQAAQLSSRLNEDRKEWQLRNVYYEFRFANSKEKLQALQMKFENIRREHIQMDERVRTLQSSQPAMMENVVILSSRLRIRHEIFHIYHQSRLNGSYVRREIEYQRSLHFEFCLKYKEGLNINGSNNNDTGLEQTVGYSAISQKYWERKVIESSRHTRYELDDNSSAILIDNVNLNKRMDILKHKKEELEKTIGNIKERVHKIISQTGLSKEFDDGKSSLHQSFDPTDVRSLLVTKDKLFEDVKSAAGLVNSNKKKISKKSDDLAKRKLLEQNILEKCEKVRDEINKMKAKAFAKQIKQKMLVHTKDKLQNDVHHLHGFLNKAVADSAKLKMDNTELEMKYVQMQEAYTLKRYKLALSKDVAAREEREMEKRRSKWWRRWFCFY